MGIPRRSGSRGALAPPPLSPRAARPAPLREDGAALSGQCAGLRAWSSGGGGWRAARGGGGAQAATPSEHSPLPGDGESAAGCARPPDSALVGVGCSDVRAGGSGCGGAAWQPSRPARGPRPPGEPGLGGRGGGSAGARLEDCHWPEAGGRVGARRGRERAASLEEPRGQGAGCAGGVRLPGGSGAQRVFVPPASTEPPHWCLYGGGTFWGCGATSATALILLERAVITAHVKTVMVELVTGYRGSTESGQAIASAEWSLHLLLGSYRWYICL